MSKPSDPTGVELTITKPQKVRAKELHIYCKVSDMFTASLVDDRGEELFNQDDGYVPSFMPGEHFGDYVILNIDLATGQILNWKPPTAKDLETWMKKED